MGLKIVSKSHKLIKYLHASFGEKSLQVSGVRLSAHLGSRPIDLGISVDMPKHKGKVSVGFFFGLGLRIHQDEKMNSNKPTPEYVYHTKFDL